MRSRSLSGPDLAIRFQRKPSGAIPRFDCTVRPRVHAGSMTSSRVRFRAGNEPVDGELLVDCASCTMRDLACHACVVSVLLGPPQMLDESSRMAIAVLADSGLVPPLRLVPQQSGAA